jgi:hypothetical protein
MTIKDNPIDTHIEIKEMKEWKIKELTDRSNSLVPMSRKEIKEAIQYLRDNHYPKPSDCPDKKCTGYRPACHLDVCYVAVRLCGDF